MRFRRNEKKSFVSTTKKRMASLFAAGSAGNQYGSNVQVKNSRTFIATTGAIKLFLIMYFHHFTEPNHRTTYGNSRLYCLYA